MFYALCGKIGSLVLTKLPYCPIIFVPVGVVLVLAHHCALVHRMNVHCTLFVVQTLKLIVGRIQT